MFQPLCQAYHDLAEAYKSNDPEEVRKSVEKHQEVFNRVGQ